MTKDFLPFDHYFYARPEDFPNWPYPSRQAINTDIDKAKFRNSPVWRFLRKSDEKMHEISRIKALSLGRKFVKPGIVCPHLLPIEEFDRVYGGKTETIQSRIVVAAKPSTLF